MKLKILILVLLLNTPTKKDRNILDLRNRGGMYYVELEMNNKPITLLIDTGASVSVLDIKNSNKYKYTTRKSNAYINGIGGRVCRYFVYGASLRSPGVEKKIKFIFEAADLKEVTKSLRKRNLRIDGIIGSDFLRKTKAVINYSENTLEITL